MASTPVAAVISGGRPSVSSASRMATSGKMIGLDTPRFSSSPTVMIETGVTSEPVPDVVGASANGNLGPFAWPTPQAPSRSSLEPNKSAASFATSREDPPPKPTTPVAPASFPALIAASSVAREGSASTASKTVGSAPAAVREAIAGSQRPRRRKPGSVTNSGEGPKRAPNSSPRRRLAPGSKTIDGVVLKTNGVMAALSSTDQYVPTRKSRPSSALTSR